MTNHLLTLTVLVALVGTFCNAPVPVPEPLPRSAASRATTSVPAVASHANADSSTMEAHQPPIPLMRNARTAKTVISAEVAAPETKTQAQDDLGSGGVRAAIEADGYKGVRVLGKAGSGTWRAKAYRGQTEVRLTVDGTGRVSAD